MALMLCLVPASSYAGVFISINFGPPVLPVYEQPICPEPNLIWMPGYWSYGDDGYFWVPGAWVPAPFEGGLWTPPYWGWSEGLYVFHPGYWGYHVGYYGGVNYGFGYGGIGFAGGEWRGGVFAYNTAVMHVDERIIHTTYVDRTIVERGYVARDSHVAYSGGPGGINHPPAPQELVAAHEQHTPPTSFQTQHIQAAQSNRQSFAKFNGGRPATLAVARPLPVETHAAPAISRPAIEGNGQRFGGAENGGRPAYAGQPVNSAPRETPPTVVRPNTSTEFHPNSNPPARTPEVRTVTPPHNYTPPKENAAPKSNPKPAPKSKPEHEK
jgi:hypothetical protein